ncbi:MAG TPA: hypothetical protein VJ939_09375 [Bacteroidales bacterium]|nr:hypothetical protein [Bacteroidales bacterium]
MRRKLLILVSALLVLAGAKATTTMNKEIDPSVVEQVKSTLIEKHGNAEQFRIERGVSQAASLWREIDGSPADFKVFCTNHFVE